MDPGTPAKRMLVLLHYVDGDLGDPATYQAMSDTLGQSVQRVLFYLGTTGRGPTQWSR